MKLTRCEQGHFYDGDRKARVHAAGAVNRQHAAAQPPRGSRARRSRRSRSMCRRSSRASSIRSLVLEPGRQYLIGRQEDMCDLVVSNSSVISRVHCAVKFDSADGTVTIYDKSSNGVMLGDGRDLRGGSAVLNTDCMAALSGGEVILNIVINKNRGNEG